MCRRNVAGDSLGEPDGANCSECVTRAHHALCTDAVRQHVSVDDGRRHGGADETDSLPCRHCLREPLQRFSMAQLSQ